MFFLKAWLYPVHDLTTTPDAPPAFAAIAGLPAHQGKDLVFVPLSAERQRKLYPDLQPLLSPKPRHELFARACEAAKQIPDWNVVFMDASRYRLEAVVARPPFFDADVVIEAREESGGGSGNDCRSSLHMRSRSRTGRRDFGANFTRIQEFFALLNRR